VRPCSPRSQNCCLHRLLYRDSRTLLQLPVGHLLPAGKWGEGGGILFRKLANLHCRCFRRSDIIRRYTRYHSPPAPEEVDNDTKDEHKKRLYLIVQRNWDVGLPPLLRQISSLVPSAALDVMFESACFDIPPLLVYVAFPSTCCSTSRIVGILSGRRLAGQACTSLGRPPAWRTRSTGSADHSTTCSC
jgi:hypothetical protein